MEHVVQALQESYMRMLATSAAVLEVKEAAGGERTPRTDKALNAFLESQQLFHAACDRAQEFVESVRQRIGSECLVDEATGPVAAKLAAEAASGNRAVAVSPLSAVRLEQLSKAVRWLVLDLQQSATASSTSMGSNQGQALSGSNVSAIGSEDV